jgi:Tfp pilus assembly protein PilN
MNNDSFLPEDYLVQRAERRTNIISLSLFGIVMVAVIGAFFVTNRQATMVKQHQESINDQYQQAGIQIQELTQLESQREEMLNKAELAAALVERVPRSILMAELINRMPERLALLDFEMKSEKAKAPNSPPAGQTDSSGRLIASTRPEKP